MLEVWVDDRLVPADRAMVSVFDRGFRSGEGVFETLRVYGERPFRLDAHLARAAEGAAALGFDLGPLGRVSEACRTVAASNAARLGPQSVLRVTATPGAIAPASPFPGTPDGDPTLVITSHPLELPPDLYDRGIRAATVPWRRELPRVKTVSYVASAVARRHARDRGAEEALFTDPAKGQVLEGAASNLFIVVDGRLVTPAAEEVLAGVTRAVVLEAAAEEGIAVEERSVTSDALLSCGEAFLTATTREVVPLVAVDDHPIGDGTPGPVTRRLHAAYRRAVAAELDAGGS